MGFRDRLKSVFGSGKKEDIEIDNSDEKDKSEPIESLGHDDDSNIKDGIDSTGSHDDYDNRRMQDRPAQDPQIRNFRYLDDLIHGGQKVIVLDSDIVLSEWEESEYRKGIRLDVDDIVIDGAGNAIDACGKVRIFSCLAENVTLKNVTLKNAYCEYSGGAISNEGELNIYDSFLLDNKTLVGGGAIDNDGVLKIKSCTFSTNFSEIGGGAIYNYGDVKIIDTLLSDNASNYMCYELFGSGGGAIYNGGNFRIVRSLLKDNATGSMWGGGAIYNCGNLDIVESSLSNNKTEIFRYVIGGCIDLSPEYCGGAVYNRGSLHVSDSELSQNKSTLGGAIYSSGDLNISDSLFSDNIAVNGGAIGCNKDSGLFTAKDGNVVKYESNGDLSIKNSEFGNNEARIGGALYGNNIDVSDCKFYDNAAVKFGGTIRNSELLVSEVSHDPIVTGSFGKGGAISGANLNISNSRFQHNVSCEGGAIYNGVSEEWSVISDSIFCSNEADCGGAIYNEFKLRVMNSQFRGNYSVQGKSIFNYPEQLEEHLEVVDSQFDDYEVKEANTRDDEADDGAEGLIEIRNFKYLDDLIHSGVKRVVLDSDIVLGYGEESEYYSGIELDIDDLVIDGNGHAIDARGKTLIFKCSEKNITIKNITLKNGFSVEGGAINAQWSTLTLIGAKFIENTAETGGAIYCYKSNLRMSESILNKNTAQSGGAIFYTSSLLEGITELFIEKSSINENKADDEGGALYLSADTSGCFKILNCEFSDNHASESIIYNNDYLQIFNTDFHNNASKRIIANVDDESNLGLIYGRFVDNDAGEYVIFNAGKFCTVEKTIFENNLSGSNSSNIANHGELTLVNPKISDAGKTVLNEGYTFIKDSSQDISSSIYGGGMVEIDEIPDVEKFDFGYLDKKIHECASDEFVLEEDICLENYERYFYEGGIDLDIDNLIIDGDGHTIDGAGKSRIFMVTGNNITLKNIIFKNGQSYKNCDNPINNNGGAIKINHDNKITIEDCTFVNNASEDVGGAIQNIRGELKINDSEFNENSAKGSGGAIHNLRGKLTINDSVINENSANVFGGAILHESGELIINHSILNENAVKERGGAIYHNDDVIITESKLNKNTASYGGAIYNNDDSKLDIQETEISHNTAHRGAGISTGHRSIITVSESILSDNSSTSYGGAIDNEGELTITGSTLKENTSDDDGGAIHNNGGKLSLIGSTFIHNVSEMRGNAVFNYRQEGFSIRNCNLDYFSGDIYNWSEYDSD